MARAKRADAILLAAMGLPDVRYPDGTEVSPQLDLRFDLGLCAGVRPVREVFAERARRFPDVEADAAYVDAVALGLVRYPWRFDVLVTENMFGDILSDLGAGLIGGIGMAPSADIGDEHAVFQPCHGSASDIAGEGKANPTAMFLSAALMLEWLGDRHGMMGCEQAAGLIRAAVDAAFEDGKLRPVELGGDAGTRRIAQAVIEKLQATPLETRYQASGEPDTARIP